MDAPTDLYIRAVQRKNGKIIIRAMLELEKVTFESIVQKICEDFNIFAHKASVESAVRNFLRHGYYLGFLDVGRNETFSISTAIQESLSETFNIEESSVALKQNNNKRQRR